MKRDEELLRAIHLLLENRWILKRDMPEEFYLIRQRERELRKFFLDKLDWPLVGRSRYYRLERIPAVPQPFMGIEGLTSVQDYILLCLVLAFLEDQEEEGQFLLSELLTELPALFPEEYEERLDWNSYTWRKAIVRVISVLAELKVLEIVEDRSGAFLTKGLVDGGGEALYRVTEVAQVFLRFFPRAMSSYEDAAAFCAGELREGPQEAARARQVRINRRLLLEPAYVRESGTAEADFAYLLGRRSDTVERFAESVGLTLELYEDAAMLVSIDQPDWYRDYFPVRLKGLHEVLLHLADILRRETLAAPKAYYTETDMLQAIARTRAARGKGWTKEYRDMSDKRLWGLLCREMEDWQMLRLTTDGLFELLPPFWRLVGDYGEEIKDGK